VDGRQEGRGDESVSLGCGKRYALDEPSTDGPPWPFGYGLNGQVTGPQLSRGVSLVVLDRNDTDPRPVARCRHSQIIQRVFDSAMRFAGGPLDREDISLGAALVGLVVAHKCRYGRVSSFDVVERDDFVAFGFDCDSGQCVSGRYEVNPGHPGPKNPVP
jgi:hypothetical protein